MSLCQASLVYLCATSPVVSLDAAGTAAAELADEAPDPLGRLLGAERRQRVAAFVARLPPRDRDIIHSLFWRDESQRRVAGRLGVSQPAVAKALRRITEIGRREFAHLR